MVHSGLMIESLEVLRCDSGLLTSFPYGKWIQKANKAVMLKAAGAKVCVCVCVCGGVHNWEVRGLRCVGGGNTFWEERGPTPMR